MYNTLYFSSSANRTGVSCHHATQYNLYISSICTVHIKIYENKRKLHKCKQNNVNGYDQKLIYSSAPWGNLEWSWIFHFWSVQVSCLYECTMRQKSKRRVSGWKLELLISLEINLSDVSRRESVPVVTANISEGTHSLTVCGKRNLSSTECIQIHCLLSLNETLQLWNCKVFSTFTPHCSHSKFSESWSRSALNSKWSLTWPC